MVVVVVVGRLSSVVGKITEQMGGWIEVFSHEGNHSSQRVICKIEKINHDQHLTVCMKSSKVPSAALVQQPKKTYDALLQLASQKGVHVKATHRHRIALYLSNGVST